jgi:hypothetical protein
MNFVIGIAILLILAKLGIYATRRSTRSISHFTGPCAVRTSVVNHRRITRPEVAPLDEIEEAIS